MTKRVWIYCGVSGAGKSSFIEGAHPDAEAFSADHFFMVDGEYRFDASKLGEAHAACLRNFTEAIQDGSVAVVVDNTNTTIAEIAPYAALAQAYGYELQIVTIYCDPEVAHARNTHGVPLAAVQAMSERLNKREIPPWWPHSQMPMLNSQEAA